MFFLPFFTEVNETTMYESFTLQSTVIDNNNRREKLFFFLLTNQIGPNIGRNISVCVYNNVEMYTNICCLNDMREDFRKDFYFNVRSNCICL